MNNGAHDVIHGFSLIFDILEVIRVLFIFLCLFPYIFTSFFNFFQNFSLKYFAGNEKSRTFALAFGKTPGAPEKRSLFDILEQEKRQGSAALLLSSRRDEYVKRTSILLYFIYIGEERLLGRTDKKRQFVPFTGAYENIILTMKSLILAQDER